MAAEQVRGLKENGASLRKCRCDKASVRSICCRISTQTAPKFGLMDEEWMVKRLSRMMSAWANYYRPGIPGHRRARDQAAATASLKKTQSEEREARALLEQKTVARRPATFRGRRNELERKPDAGIPHVRDGEQRRGNVMRGGDRGTGARRKPPANRYSHRLPKNAPAANSTTLNCCISAGRKRPPKKSSVSPADRNPRMRRRAHHVT